MIFKGLKSSFQYRYKRVFYVSMVVLLVLPFQTYTKDLCGKLFINIRNKVFSGQPVRKDLKSQPSSEVVRVEVKPEISTAFAEAMTKGLRAEVKPEIPTAFAEEMTKGLRVETNPKTPEAFVKAMTQGLLSREEEADLLKLYINNWFGDFSEKIDKDKEFTLLFQVFKKYPELSKPPLRDQIMEISIKEYEPSRSLIQFIQSFKKSSKKRRNNLFQIEANIGFWHKIFDFQKASLSSNLNREEQLESFKDYFKKFISEENLKFIENSSILYREKIIGFYTILNEARDQLLIDKKEVRYISQAMVDLVDAAGFGNPLYEKALKSKNPIEKIDAVRKILSERNIISIELGFEGQFTELRESLNVKPNEDVSTQLLRIEDDIKNQPNKEGYKKTLRLRSLSIQESPFRSCLSGDCATASYFKKALDPNYLYFTLTDEDSKSSGHIAVVLGSAENERGEKVQVAFVDKIQEIPNDLILPTLEGIRLSLKELGYKLGLPKDVGDSDTGISNNGITRSYFEEKILPRLKVRLRKFQPYPNEYPFENEYSKERSRADKGLDMLVLGGEDRRLDNITIRPGEIYIPQTASKALSVRGLSEPVFLLEKSNNAEDQINFLKNLLVLKEIEELNITSEYVETYLSDKIKGKDIDFKVRKLALFTLIQWELKKRISLDLEFLSTQLELFSEKEQKFIIGEMSNWKDVRVSYKREFIRQVSQVLFSENKQKIEKALNSRFKILLDINAKNKSGWTALIEATKRDDREFVDFLLDRGADINVVADTNVTATSTALMEAARKGDLDFVKFLLNRGADMDFKDEYGSSTLTVAVMSGNPKLVQFLLDRGVSRNSIINDNRALMHAAGIGKNPKLVELLLENGANIDVTDIYGVTVLMEAVRHGNLEIVELLVKSGVNKNPKNKNGETALDIAKMNANRKHLKKLIRLLR